MVQAAARGHKPVVKLLLAHGDDANATDTKGCTPLFGSSVHGFLSVAKLLVEKNADIDHVDASGRTSTAAAAPTAATGACSSASRCRCKPSGAWTSWGGV